VRFLKIQSCAGVRANEEEQVQALDIIGVPSDLGVRELGVSLGPTAMRLAGLVNVLARLGFDVHDLGDIHIDVIDSPEQNPNCIHLRSIEQISKITAERVRDAVAGNRIAVCIGGDHSLAIGSVSGLASVKKRVGLVWIDAHPDANTPESTITGNIHGMPVAVLLGRGPKELTRILTDEPKVLPENLCILAARDIDPAERELLEKLNVRMYTIYDIDDKGMPRVTHEVIEQFAGKVDALHVSLDLDALTKTIAPGVGIPNSAGLTLREAHYLCKRLGETGIIRSIDVADMNPVYDLESRTAHTAIELLCLLLGKEFSFDYGSYLRRQEEASRLLFNKFQLR